MAQMLVPLSSYKRGCYNYLLYVS